jgi:hypothetical protein
LNFEFLLVLIHDEEPQRERGFGKERRIFETQSLDNNRSCRYLEEKIIGSILIP